MVLSNKKLKQKLRAELSSLSQASNPDFTSLSLSHSSLNKLLDSATPKFRLSKREKRRERSSLQQQQQQQQQPDATREGVDGHSIHGSKKEDPETKKSEVRDSAQKKKNDEKRKRKVDDDEVVNGDVKVAKKSNKKSEVGDSGQKKKNDKKRKRKVDDDEVVNGDVKVAKKSNKRRKMKQKKAKKTDKKGANRGDTSEASELAKSISSEQNGDVPTKVYVGGIPYYSTEDDIRSYFDGCGTITEVDSMKFPESGKFRGIAIINFKTEAAAKRALALDGSDMGGFFLKIQPYKRTQTSKASKFAPKPMEGYNRIYVGNLPWDITEDQLRKLFSTCSISSIRFGMDKETGEFRGYAHVDFTDNQSLKMAVALDQKVVCGRPVRITCAVPLKKPMSLENDLPKSNGDEIDSEKSSSTANANGKMKRRTCYECGEKGHISSACPKKQAVDSGTR